MSRQLALFDAPTLTMVTRCHLCPAGWGVPVEPGETWQPAMLWGWLELRRHLIEVHPSTTEGDTHDTHPDASAAP